MCTQGLGSLLKDLTDYLRAMASSSTDPVPSAGRKRKTPEEEKCFPCKVEGCNFRSKKANYLNGHMMTKHRISVRKNPEGEECFPCRVDWCNFRSKTATNTQRHMLVRHHVSNPFACQFPGCLQRCSTTTKLKMHMRAHSGMKPFLCQHPGCEKRYTENGALTQHMLSHTDNKPCACNFQDASGDLNKMELSRSTF